MLSSRLISYEPNLLSLVFYSFTARSSVGWLPSFSSVLSARSSIRPSFKSVYNNREVVYVSQRAIWCGGLLYQYTSPYDTSEAITTQQFCQESVTMEDQQEQVKLYTREELKSRCTRNDAVLIIHNGVYDVTRFLGDHPGGEEVLLEKAGQDATEPFEDVSHSSDARSLMKKYKIGELVEADRVPSKAGFAPSWNNDQPQEQGNSSWSSWLTPLLLGIAATLLYRYLFA